MIQCPLLRNIKQRRKSAFNWLIDNVSWYLLFTRYLDKHKKCKQGSIITNKRLKEETLVIFLEQREGNNFI